MLYPEASAFMNLVTPEEVAAMIAQRTTSAEIEENEPERKRVMQGVIDAIRDNKDATIAIQTAALFVMPRMMDSPTKAVLGIFMGGFMAGIQLALTKLGNSAVESSSPTPAPTNGG